MKGSEREREREHLVERRVWEDNIEIGLQEVGRGHGLV